MDEGTRSKRKAIYGDRYRWTNGIIPYQFANGHFCKYIGAVVIMNNAKTGPLSSIYDIPPLNTALFECLRPERHPTAAESRLEIVLSFVLYLSFDTVVVHLGHSLRANPVLKLPQVDHIQLGMRGSI